MISSLALYITPDFKSTQPKPMGLADQTRIFRLLLRCTEQRCTAAGRAVHSHVIKSGYWADVFLANTITNMYAKCGQLGDATCAFSDISDKDVISFNSLINAHSQLGPRGATTVAELFRNMHSEYSPLILPNAYTFSGLFTATSHTGTHCENLGIQAHCLAVKIMDCNNVFLSSSLLNMYCKLARVSDARKVFDEMPERNSVSWTAMICGYATDKCANEAFQLFVSLLREGSKEEINEFVISSLLSAISFLGCLKMGRQIHGLVVKNRLVSFGYVENSLVTFYAKNERMDDALNMFNASNNKNSITWSAMISGCAQNGESKKALDLFSQMHFSGIGSNEFTFVGALNACSDETSLLEGKQVHAYFLKQGYQNQVYVKSALLDTYAKCGCINDAQKAFDEMKSKDIVLWTAIISVFVQNGEREKALTLYLRMKREGIFPNKLTISTVLRACSNLAAFEQGKQLHAHAIKFGCNLGPPIGSALSTMYAKCGNLADCTLVFRKIPEKDIIAWNSIISAFSQNGRGKEALKLFDEMILEGTKPDNITFVNVLSACSHMGLVDKGWKYFHSMVDEYNLTPEIEHYACMVDILSRAGKLKEAKDFIEKIPINHGMCLWRIVLGACRDEKYYNIGVYAGEELIKLGSKDSAVYTLLANIYAVQKRWQDVERVRRVMRERGVGKDPACSWLEMNSKMHVFVKGELRHCEMERIRAELARLSQHIRSDFGEDFEEMIEDFERVASS